MITCPACGKENEESAFECRRCRAPLREEAAQEPASSAAFGEVCRRCEAYNEPGAKVCSNCGLQLVHEEKGEAPLDKTPEQPFAPPGEEHTPQEGTPSVADELSALALSAEEAAEAGVSGARNGEPPLDKTPEEPYPVRPPPAPAPRAPAAAPGMAARKAEPPAPPPPPRPPAKAPAPEAAAEKLCSNCGAANPPAAKFCFDCGNPFIKKAEPPPAPKVEPVKKAPPAEPPPSIQIAADLVEEAATAEAQAVPAEEEAASEEETVEAAEVAQPIEEEPAPPFAASLVVEKGSAPGTAFVLSRWENSLGSSGTQIELPEDAFIAPHAATLLFAEDHLLVRDEGSANGVYLKVRETAPLQAGDLFIAGERLLRFEGTCELPKDGEGETPFLGAPRPQGPSVVRVTEVLAAGKTGRTCHRSGPVIAIGRTGCDLNFPSDSLLAARHAEIRLAEDGSATLADLGPADGAGVFLRVRPEGTMDLQAGDILRIGEQQFRLEVG